MRKKSVRQIIFIFSILILTTAITPAQSGGTFSITQSVVAGGGQQSNGGMFSVDGTIGQPVAGNASGNSPFAVTSGFWNFTAFAPSAALVAVGGRVRTADGRGIRGVTVSLTAPDGERRLSVSSSFGYYRFENIPVGETYIISVAAKKYTFSQPTIVYAVYDEISDLDFIADPLTHFRSAQTATFLRQPITTATAKPTRRFFARQTQFGMFRVRRRACRYSNSAFRATDQSRMFSCLDKFFKVCL